jgi:hypothetical protein
VAKRVICSLVGPSNPRSTDEVVNFSTLMESRASTGLYLRCSTSAFTNSHSVVDCGDIYESGWLSIRPARIPCANMEGQYRSRTLGSWSAAALLKDSSGPALVAGGRHHITRRTKPGKRFPAVGLRLQASSVISLPREPVRSQGQRSLFRRCSIVSFGRLLARWCE